MFQPWVIICSSHRRTDRDWFDQIFIAVSLRYLIYRRPGRGPKRPTFVDRGMQNRQSGRYDQALRTLTTP